MRLITSIILFVTIAFVNGKEFKPIIRTDSTSELFEGSKKIEVIGPTVFPKPTRYLNESAVVVAEPAIGKHRADKDVVMAYAEGYQLPYYICFIDTLRQTGFDGDIVLAIADYKLLEPHVLDYLKEQENLVVYIHELHCFTSTGQPSPRIKKNGQLDIFQMCQLHDVYGWKDEAGNVIEKAKDKRIGRVVATLRYEWYWIWAQHYNPNSWIMLVDARDSYFQTNPFVDLPRNYGGLLYFFGENTEATRLGKSTKNANWLRRSYGEATLDALKDKPTICSGSTMGEQVAIETYLRAMVNEWDETDIKMTGADQGFHNYIYYSNKLANAKTIKRLVVWEQGKGIINNLGALRTKKFEEWGFYDTATSAVYNWDGELSPVVHQYDRDNHLHNYIVRQRFKDMEKEWMTWIFAYNQITSTARKSQNSDIQDKMNSKNDVDWITILGFGSLLSERSSRTTFPDLRNFRLGRVKNYRRVFGHPASIFFQRGIANMETKEMSSLSTEFVDGHPGFICSVFEVPNDDMMDNGVPSPTFLEREEEFDIIEVPYEESDGKERRGILCAAGTDEIYLKRWGKERFEDNYKKYGIDKIWGWERDSGLRPCAVYLRHCYLAAKSMGGECLDSFLDETVLVDRQTTAREYLKENPQVLETEPPPSLVGRYSG